jgi:SAM-dependent methyltransferase
MDEEDLLEEQRAYYRGRAPDYDEWWQGLGPYDRGPEGRAEWERQVAAVEDALSAFGPRGDVLELAGGTGWWTERLARTADALTVVDASAETIALNRRRVGRRDVDYVQADIFRWRPERLHDVVFFSFWLSHVPRNRFGEFWTLVRSCLAPGGRAFLIDNRRAPDDAKGRDPHVASYEPDLHRRRLKDGSEWRVVKVMYAPAELEALIEAEGWVADLDGTDYFVFGSARPA